MAKKKRISADVILVVVGVVTVISLQQCNGTDSCRYEYGSLSDCESEWGRGKCDRSGMKYHGPEQSVCHSGNGGGSGGGYGDGSGKGDKAVGIERGGFGSSSHAGYGS